MLKRYVIDRDLPGVGSLSEGELGGAARRGCQGGGHACLLKRYAGDGRERGPARSQAQRSRLATSAAAVPHISSATSPSSARQTCSEFSRRPSQNAAPPSAQYTVAHNLEKAQSARYHRLALSQRRGDPLKWFAVACLGALTLLTVALVHLENWRSQLAAMLIYASAISVGFTAAYLERSPFQAFVVSSQPIAELIDAEPSPDRR